MLEIQFGYNTTVFDQRVLKKRLTFEKLLLHRVVSQDRGIFNRISVRARNFEFYLQRRHQSVARNSSNRWLITQTDAFFPNMRVYVRPRINHPSEASGFWYNGTCRN